MEARLNTEKADWEQFPYLDSADVIAVQRGPEPGGLGGVARTFGATLKGLRTTFARIIEGPITIQYPEEKTPVFVEQLTARKYWKDYLEEKYPGEFTRLQQQFQAKASELEDQYPELNTAYLQEMEALDSANKTERLQLLTRLSEREIAELGAQA